MQMLNYNVPHGKLNRGMAVLDVYRSLKKGQASRLDRPKQLGQEGALSISLLHSEGLEDAHA